MSIAELDATGVLMFFTCGNRDRDLLRMKKKANAAMMRAAIGKETPSPIASLVWEDIPPDPDPDPDPDPAGPAEPLEEFAVAVTPSAEKSLLRYRITIALAVMDAAPTNVDVVSGSGVGNATAWTVRGAVVWLAYWKQNPPDEFA
jgi:hypothetical protein